MLDVLSSKTFSQHIFWKNTFCILLCTRFFKTVQRIVRVHCMVLKNTRIAVLQINWDFVSVWQKSFCKNLVKYTGRFEFQKTMHNVFVVCFWNLTHANTAWRWKTTKKVAYIINASNMKEKTNFKNASCVWFRFLLFKLHILCTLHCFSKSKPWNFKFYGWDFKKQCHVHKMCAFLEYCTCLSEDCTYKNDFDIFGWQLGHHFIQEVQHKIIYKICANNKIFWRSSSMRFWK